MTERCPFCGQASEMIWVRAHYQCSACGQIVVPCCNGETAFDCPAEAGSAVGGSLWPDVTSISESSTNRKDA